MTRLFFIQRLLRQVYNGEPPDSASITTNFVNSLLNDAIAVATKKHYGESLQIENISFISNSFYTTFRGIAITSGLEFGYYTAQLPQVPLALGKNDSIASIRVNDINGISQPIMRLSVEQVNQYDKLPKPIGIPVWEENSTLVFNSPSFPLYTCTAVVRMVSGGDSTKLDSQLNIPDEWMPVVNDYVLQKCMVELQQPKDVTNDGAEGK